MCENQAYAINPAYASSTTGAVAIGGHWTTPQKKAAAVAKAYVLGEVKAVKDAADPNGEFEVVLSAPTLDRDGEILDAKCFEPLPDHITFDIDHGLSTATTVGSGQPFYDGDLLKVRGTFSSIPRAQEVRTLVTEGHIRTTSVAMMGAKKEVKDGVAHITKAELLNGAFVPVPANREALVVSSKAGARHSASDREAIANIYAQLEALGFACPACAATAGEDEEKSVGESDATGAGEPAAESTREDATGAGGDDEQQQLELRTLALQLLARSVT